MATKNSYRFIVTGGEYLSIEYMLGWDTLQDAQQALKRKFHPSYNVEPLYGVSGAFGLRAKDLGYDY